MSLLELAKAKFSDRELTRAEQELFVRTEKGERTHKLSDQDEDRMVAARCIEWLCTERDVVKLVTHRGIDIQGLTVSGRLELQFAQIPFPFQTGNCIFEDPIVLLYAHLPALYLIGTQTGQVQADGLKIDGWVLFRDKSQAQDEVSFLGSEIGGGLDLSDAEFLNPGKLALQFSTAKIAGPAYLRNTQTQGGVNFTGATVGLDVDLSGARLLDPEKEITESNEKKKIGGRALTIDGAKIGGNLFMRGGFTAEGQIGMIGANIDGNVECDGARIAAGENYAFNGEKAIIGGNLFFRSNRTPKGLIPMYAEGSLNLFGAQIGSSFVWINVDVTPKTVLNLQGAKIRTLHDEGAWPAKGNVFLDGLTYDRIDQRSSTNARERINWLKCQADEPFLPQPYEQLAMVLRNMGHEGQAREVMVEKNREYARSIARSLKQQKWPQKIWGRISKQEWWWHNIFGRLNGYGYKPWRAFFLSVAMIFFGWGLFHFGYTRDLISPEKDYAFRKNAFGHVVASKDIVQKHRLSKSYPKFNAFAYSLESFVPLLKLDQSSNWTPNAHHGQVFFVGHLHATIGTLLRAYLWCHIIAGWVLTSLWVGGLTGLVKT